MKSGNNPSTRYSERKAPPRQAINVSHDDENDFSLAEKDILGQKIKPEVVTEEVKTTNHIKIEGRDSISRLMMRLTKYCNKLILFYHTA